jgi:hypothetical protein
MPTRLFEKQRFVRYAPSPASIRSRISGREDAAAGEAGGGVVRSRGAGQQLGCVVPTLQTTLTPPEAVPLTTLPMTVAVWLLNFGPNM